MTMFTLLRLFFIAAVIYFVIQVLKKYLAPNQTRDFKHSTNMNSPYEVLGVSKEASEQEIKKAYKEKLAQYHPDKVEHLGSDIQELAREKTRAIQEAYRALSSHTKH